ncbi:unnamed protein product [Cuscuta campestris]|uniref:Protein kinase domain-containing protein n=1 Tax=Cuscuta campestris TaxID=132261 RepID=A0A484LWE9_9ASTE|nr:unnamed protein product [Cuscuta campestris]
MGNGRIVALSITVCVVSFVISKIVIAVLCYRRWRRKHMAEIRHCLSDMAAGGGKLLLFRTAKTKALKSEAVVNRVMKLGSKDVIGSGGFGTVYKVVMEEEGVSFAIKRLNRISAEEDRGFERELDAMADIKHRNIVTLHGYYSSPHYNLLIYELMPNGSLDKMLHDKSPIKKVLDWESRLRIAVGAARGLSYLHHDCIPHIIHRDIKSSNILLDQNMEAQVSDFGLATLMEPNKTHVSTLVAGTFGYLPPEYFETGKATVKGDIYSFGVVLLELITGRRPTDEAFVEAGTKLVGWVKAVIADKREEYVVDHNLAECRTGEITQFFNVAMMCLEYEPSKRPTMAEVVKMLEQIKLDGLV